jgi:hypothetical protein
MPVWRSYTTSCLCGLRRRTDGTIVSTRQGEVATAEAVRPASRQEGRWGGGQKCEGGYALRTGLVCCHGEFMIISFKKNK